MLTHELLPITNLLTIIFTLIHIFKLQMFTGARRLRTAAITLWAAADATATAAAAPATATSNATNALGVGYQDLIYDASKVSAGSLPGTFLPGTQTSIHDHLLPW